MGAPANDNLANAIALAEGGGSGWFNNIGATAEANEPANFGHTVWFSWTQDSPNGFQDQLLFIDTRQPDGVPPGNLPYLNTTVRIFSSGMIELPYTVAGNKQYGQNPLSFGSYVIVFPATFQTVYIRIDGSVTDANLSAPDVNQGWFFLRWGLSNGGLPSIGKCGNCTNSLGLSTTCITTFQGPDLANGDIKGPNAFSVRRQSATAPAGTYMLRYCSGYYELLATENGRYQYGTIGGNSNLANGSFSAALFRSNVAHGVQLSPYSPQETGTSVGDVTPSNGANGGSFYNGSGFVTDADLAEINGLVITQSSPGATTSATYDSLPILLINQNCKSYVFNHAGGDLDWVSWLEIGNPGNNVATDNPSNGNLYDTDISKYVTDCAFVNPGVGTFVPWLIGPAGVPTYQLVRINPRIAVQSSQLVYDNSGFKNADLSVTLVNLDTFTWSTVTMIGAGLFSAEDPGYFPGTPVQQTTFNPSGTYNYTGIRFNMTPNGNVGQMTIALSDANHDVFQGSPLTINFTPAFGNLAITRVGSGTFQRNGKTVISTSAKLTNIGNSTTIAAGIVFSATVGGQPIQICGVDQSGTLTPFGATFTYKPNFGNSDPVLNPSGNGLGWNPNFQVQNVNLFLPVIVGQAQTVVVTATVIDGSNTFPSSQVTVLVPAG